MFVPLIILITSFSLPGACLQGDRGKGGVRGGNAFILDTLITYHKLYFTNLQKRGK